MKYVFKLNEMTDLISMGRHYELALPPTPFKNPLWETINHTEATCVFTSEI